MDDRIEKRTGHCDRQDMVQGKASMKARYRRRSRSARGMRRRAGRIVWLGDKKRKISPVLDAS